MKTAAALLLCIGAFGCSGPTIKEGDRMVVDQTGKGLDVVLRKLDIIAAAFGEPVVAEIREIVLDLKANVDSTRKVVGEPKEPKAYTKGNSKEARDQQASDHAPRGWWYGAGMTVLTIAGFIGRRILASYVPWLATATERANDANTAGIAKARSESMVVKVGDQEIDMIPVAKLDGHLSAEQLRANVKAFMAAKAKEIEESLRLDPKSV